MSHHENEDPEQQFGGEQEPTPYEQQQQQDEQYPHDPELDDFAYNQDPNDMDQQELDNYEEQLRQLENKSPLYQSQNKPMDQSNNSYKKPSMMSYQEPHSGKYSEAKSQLYQSRDKPPSQSIKSSHMKSNEHDPNQQQLSEYSRQQSFRPTPSNQASMQRQTSKNTYDMEVQVQHQTQKIDHDYQKAFKDIQYQPTETEQELVNQQFQESYDKEREVSEVPAEAIYTQHNLRVYNNFILNYRTQLFQYYQEFSKDFESEHPSIKCADIPLVMRVGFYLGNVTFHEFKEDQLEFFEKPEAFKKLMAYQSSFLQFQKKNDDVNYQRLNFTDFLEFVQFFLKRDPQIFLRNNEDVDFSINKPTKPIVKKANLNTSMAMNLEREILDNIDKYENQLMEVENDKQRDIIQTILRNLREQLEKLGSSPGKRNISSKGSKRKLNQSRTSLTSANRTKEERRQKNLGEIFTFYCKQKYVQGAQYTFERIQHESNVMEIGKFNIFCKQFNLLNHHPKLMKREIPVLFKKNSSNYKEMNIHEFKGILEKIALLMYEMKDEEFPTDHDKLEAFYKFIQIDDPDVYRKKFQILNPAFDTREKVDYRLHDKDQGREIKLKPIEKNRLDELKKKKIQEKLNYLKYLEESKLDAVSGPGKAPRNLSQGNVSMSSLNINSVNSLLNNNKSRLTFESYGIRKRKDQDVVTKFNSQISWQDLESVTYTDLKTLQQGQFRPEDLFDENDDPDDKLYLAEYNLQKDKQKKQIENYIKYDDAKNYGNYKESLRPSQKYLMQHNPAYELGQRYVVTKNTHEDNRDYLKSIPTQPQTMKSSISNAYLQRAQQLDRDIDRKERELMEGIVSRGDQKVQRGINAAKKI